MGTVVLILIILGSILMVANIITYILFMRGLNDVISSGKRMDNILMLVGLILLIFFLVGYLVVGLYFASDNLVVGLILFFGSVFVSIMLTMMYVLIRTAKNRSLEIAQVLIDVVDARDPNLHGHSTHVKNLTMMFFGYLPSNMRHGINPLSLEYASLMHDVGKLGIPESILNKPGKLNDEEWAIMRKHPQLGVKFLSEVSTFKVISDWILYHHERPDGNGYYHKKPEEVPLPAKIISICDTYSAIIQSRSYKAPRSHEEALKIIEEVAGSQLDEELAKLFITIPKEEFEKCLP